MVSSHPRSIICREISLNYSKIIQSFVDLKGGPHRNAILSKQNNSVQMDCNRQLSFNGAKKKEKSVEFNEVI